MSRKRPFDCCQYCAGRLQYWVAILMTIGSTIILTSCGTQRQITAESPLWVDDDRHDIAEPKKRDPDLAWTSIDRTFFGQIKQATNLERDFRHLFGNPKQATNINSFDEVPNSSWFNNRIGLLPFTPEDVRRGRVVSGGPDTAGTWSVFRPKVQGATPGFWIEDSQGNQYIIKFDPPDYPEMSTAAAAMGARYFHACGYNVPQETIVHFRPDNLRVKEGTIFRDRKGHKREFTDADLKQILSEVHTQPDGKIRSLASLSLGNVKGPFSYDGRRGDDPNDWFRHENRRELRGLYVIASLINHYDTKDHNTLDVYEEDNGRHFLRHYLIDFGSTFGADGDSPKPPKKGYANIFDLRDVGSSLFTLGMKTWPWENASEVQYPSIGYFESEIFQPNKFDPILPNPAFEEMTNRDAYWGAKIVMAFRDEHLRSLVESGQLTDDKAREYLFQILRERRDKIGRFWFARVNPLDNFELSYEADDLIINFSDLSVDYGFENNNAAYRYSIKYGNKKLIESTMLESTQLQLSGALLSDFASHYPSDRKNDRGRNNLYRIELETSRDNGRKWSKPTLVWLWFNPKTSAFRMAGIEHLD